MEILTRVELQLRETEIIRKIKQGAVFIHPTDTIYGLGCSALQDAAVNKIRKLKDRPVAPFSIWVPSRAWIQKNCILTAKAEKWLQKLPGPYTLILKLKSNSIAKSVAPGRSTIGIRWPEHWFSQIVEKAAIPIVTTSANKSGQPFMIALENLDPAIEQEVEFMIYEGEKDARPSTILDVETEEMKAR